MLRQTNQQPITALYPRLSHEDELQGESNSITSLSHISKVLRIQTEGTQKRREAEAELGRIEGELKQKLLALRT